MHYLPPIRRLSIFLGLLGTLLLAHSLAWAAEGIIAKTPDSTGKFCHLKFPSIREDTLHSDRPVLKHPGEGDIVDIYAPCDYDPLGKEEVARQRAYRAYIRYQHYHSD